MLRHKACIVFARLAHVEHSDVVVDMWLSRRQVLRALSADNERLSISGCL